MAEQTVRGQLVEALAEQRQAVTIYIVEMDKAMKGVASYERGQKLAALVSTLQRSLDDSAVALDRARAETERPDCESAGYLLPCDTSCPCYVAGTEAQRERVGGGMA